MVSWFDLFSCASAQSSPVRQVGGRFPHAPADFNQAGLANSRNAPGLSNQLERLLSLFACSWPMNSLADVAPASSPGVLAGVFACACIGPPARCSCRRRDAAATRSRDGCCATWFMESL